MSRRRRAERRAATPLLPTGVPTGPPLTMRGVVWDTTNLPISGAQVQVVAPSRGTVAVTDENGQFLMPWPFTGTVTVRASKEGFHAREISVPEPGAPRYPVSLGFELEAIDSPIIVAGMYNMTFTAANECTQLPTVARQRTYRAQVYPNGGVAGSPRWSSISSLTDNTCLPRGGARGTAANTPCPRRHRPVREPRHRHR